MLNFLYVYLKVINFWFLGLGNDIVKLCKINKRHYSRLFLMGEVPVASISSNTDWVIGGYVLNMWWVLICAVVIFSMVVFLMGLIDSSFKWSWRTSCIIDDCISGSFLFFFLYWAWYFKDQVVPGAMDAWTKKMGDLKINASVGTSSNIFLLDIFYKNPPMFLICIIMIILPLIFFIYSTLVAVSFIDQRNLRVRDNLNHWVFVCLLGIWTQIFSGLYEIDTLFFSENVSLWLLSVHKRLWLSSMSIVVLLYYFSVFYRLVAVYPYFNRLQVVMLKMFEKYTVDMWKKRFFALLGSSFIYVAIVVYGAIWPKPFNLLADWVEIVTVFSFFLLSWELPGFGFFGAILSGNTLTRIGHIENVPKFAGKVKPKIMEEAKPYFMNSKGRTPQERWQNARLRAKWLAGVAKERETQILKSELDAVKAQLHDLKHPTKPSTIEKTALFVGDVIKKTPSAIVAGMAADEVVTGGKHNARLKSKMVRLVKKGADKVIDVLPDTKGHSEPKMP